MVRSLRVSCIAELIDIISVGCGMWYRRITEYNDVDPSPLVSLIPLRKPREEVVVFGEASFSKIIFGPGIPEHISASKKRKREQVQNDDITLFKRVRVLSKKTRVRRIEQILGPFTGLAAAGNGFEKVSTRHAYDHLILKSSTSTSNQPSETTSEKENVGRSMTDSTPAAFLDLVAVPRTDYIPSMDDSDDGGDDSDGDGNDSDDDVSSPPVLVPRDQLLARGASVNNFDHASWTPLMRAAEYGNAASVSSLLSHNSDPDMKNIYGDTALQIASEEGHFLIVKMLLAHGASMSTDALAGKTELQLATAKGHTRLVRFLLERGADILVKDSRGSTLLHKAAAGVHDAVILLLLQNGADVEVKDDLAQTPLMVYDKQKRWRSPALRRHRKPVTPCQKELAVRKWHYRSVGTKAPDSPACLNEEQGRDEPSVDRPP